jgi:G:T-mismatch repair DNA endonuclease (very short patch repair protein)
VSTTTAFLSQAARARTVITTNEPINDFIIYVSPKTSKKHGCFWYVHLIYYALPQMYTKELYCSQY